MTTLPVAGRPAPGAAPRRWSPALAAAGEAAPTLVWVALWIGALLVLRLWWTSTPHIADDAGDVLTNAGRLLGLAAGYLCPVQLLLMARIPVLESVVGTHRLAAWHGRIGRYLINALLGHVAFVTIGYAETARHGWVGQFLDLEQQYPDVLMATFGFVLLVGVGITSARAARRRLRYETWYLLHLYTYLAVGLAFAHQLATGAQFLGDRTAREWWSGMYLVTVGLLLWFRVFVPIRTLWRHRVTVAEVRPESDGVVSVRLAGVDVGALRAQPGQYLRLRFVTPTGWWQSHPFSLSAVPTGDSLRVTVKSRGDHTAGLDSSLRPGVRVVVEGPYGALTERRRSRRRVLLVAGGIGITPLRALFESLQGQPGDVTLLYRSRRTADVVFRAELDRVAADRGFAVHYLTGPRGGTAEVTAATLDALVPDVADRDIYLCGPAGLEESVTRTLRAAGVPATRIHTEHFDF